MRLTYQPGGNDGTPWAAAVITVAAWLLALVALGFALLSDTAPRGENLFLFVDITVAAVYGTVAGVILWRRRHVVVWLLALAAIGGGISAVAGAYGIWQEAQPAAAFSFAWVPGTLALFTVIPWLIRDHPLGVVAWLGVIAGTIVSIGFTWISYEQILNLQKPFLYATIVVGLAAAAEAGWRHLYGPADERVGLGWLALGTAVMALSFVPLLLPWGTVPISVTPIVHLLCQAFFPAAILVSVLRQRLWGIDIAVSRTVTAGAVTVGLLALYAAIAAWAPGVFGGEGTANVAATVAVVAAVQPSRIWVEHRVQSLVYGAGHDPATATRSLTSQLRGTAGTDELLDGLAQSVTSMLRLESVTIRAEDAVVASSGTPTSTPLDHPLVHAGTTIGTLSVTAPPGEALGGRAIRAIDDLTPVVAAGLAVTLSSWRLEAAQAQLTRARLQERKVIRRELHDGLGPSLTGLRLGLQGARNLVATDPAAAEQILGALQSELDHRVDEVRELSHSLLPPVLAELGLQAALTELAARQHESGLDVVVRCPATVDLADEVAGAAYAIVSEAVTNVSRHSGADACSVTVDIEAATLSILVEDAGAGFPADHRPGVGTSSMRERAEELGGTVAIEPRTPRGTRVAVSLPLVAGKPLVPASGRAR